MDENMWRLTQMFMWIIGIQTAVLIAVLGAIWSSISKKVEGIDKKVDSLEKRLDKIELQVNNIDKRLFAVETLLHMKECCMLKDSQDKKAE